LGLRWQINEDPVLTASLRLPGDPHGVLITGANWGGSSCGVLRPRDLLLSLDGHEIDASGYYRHPRYGLLRFTTITTDGHRAGEAFKHPEGDFHRIILEPNGQMAQVILDAKTFDAATSEIQESYRVPAPVRTAPPPPEFGAACGS